MRLLAVLLALLMLPSIGEILEIAAHAIDHGDLSHVLDREDHEHPKGDEHHCSSLFHLCGSPAGSSLPPAVAGRTMGAPDAGAPVVFAELVGLYDQFRPAPALRPPIA